MVASMASRRAAAPVLFFFLLLLVASGARTHAFSTLVSSRAPIVSLHVF